jgi:chaperonin GroEL (HSP60 family)
MQQEITNLIKPAEVKNHMQDYFISAIESGEFSAPTNILDSVTYGSDLNEYIATILDHLATAVGSTFGPAGLNTIIHKSDMSHSFSKDGYSVLREIMYNEPVANTVKELVKNVSRKMTLTVGDGSTTVVLVTSAIYNVLNNLNHPCE